MSSKTESDSDETTDVSLSFDLDFTSYESLPSSENELEIELISSEKDSSEVISIPLIKNPDTLPLASPPITLECSICLEEINQTGLPSVGCHPLHAECASQLTSPKCPMCRSPLDLPKKLMRKIKDNGRQAKLEGEESERLDILSNLSNLRYMDPRIQRQTAKSYLLALGIKKIKLRYDLGSGEGNEDDEGESPIDIFSAIVTSTIESKRRELYKKDIIKVNRGR